MTYADLLPMLNETVRHATQRTRNVYGKASSLNGFTEHPARVTFKAVLRTMPASNQPQCVAAVTMWLVDHPHPVAAGDVFQLATGEQMEVADFERRTDDGHTILKVFLK